jgi:hypothetical protein
MRAAVSPSPREVGERVARGIRADVEDLRERRAPGEGRLVLAASPASRLHSNCLRGPSPLAPLPVHTGRGECGRPILSASI